MGCSPWGHEELDTTERLPFHFSLLCIGEGHGNPLHVLAWRIPGTGKPAGLPSMGSHRVRHDVMTKQQSPKLSTVFTFTFTFSFFHGRVCCLSVLPYTESEREVAQLCPTLCDPMDCSPPGSSIHGIFQARVLEWAAISFSRGSS